MRKYPGRALALTCVILAAGVFTGQGPMMAGEARAQSEAQFAKACQASGKRSAAACTCQAKLARRNLNAREQRAALAAMRGDETAMAREVKAMGKKGVQSFDAKMGRLSALSRKTCI